MRWAERCKSNDGPPQQSVIIYAYRVALLPQALAKYIGSIIA